uniref:Sugar fermentation stimulation protein C-terminal domain-containing protein n=1 Tax=viral metagenome TaxID=1070528 RepID=A0A6C0KDC0_9ZZZZ
MILFTIQELHKGIIVKRPSAHIKTPYVADVTIQDIEFLAHTPSLGCCGLADKGSQVLMEKTEKTKTNFRVQLAIFNEPEKNNIQYIGINPKLSETLVKNALLNNCFHNLKYIKKIGREKKILNSRFDFIGVDKDDRSFILEVKAVPLADYDDIYAKERKKKDYTNRTYDSKISYFPDGYRKKLKDTVSPRALKHVQELEQIKQKEPNMRCILCFVIQRTDVKQFQPSLIDPIYRKAVQKAWINGVEIFTLQVSWTVDGVASFHSSKLPICLFETYGPRKKIL